MNAWSRMITRALRSVLSPRMGFKRAFSRPWSASIRLFAYLACRGTRRGSAPRQPRGASRRDPSSLRTARRERAVPTQRTVAQLKRRAVAKRTRQQPDRPGRSPDRRKRLRPATFTYVSSTNQRSPTVCRDGQAASTRSGVTRCTQRYKVTWSTSIPRSARSSSTSRYDRPNRRYHRTADTTEPRGRSPPEGPGTPRR
jgi:hypothetical protein